MTRKRKPPDPLDLMLGTRRILTGTLTNGKPHGLRGVKALTKLTKEKP